MGERNKEEERKGGREISTIPFIFPKSQWTKDIVIGLSKLWGLGWEGEDTEGDVTSERLSCVRDSLGVFPKENGSQFIDNQAYDTVQERNSSQPRLASKRTDFMWYWATRHYHVQVETGNPPSRNAVWALWHLMDSCNRAFLWFPSPLSHHDFLSLVEWPSLVGIPRDPSYGVSGWFPEFPETQFQFSLEKHRGEEKSKVPLSAVNICPFSR